MENYSKISQTAQLTTVLRLNTGIPYAEEIARLCGAEAAVKKMFGADYALAIKKRAAYCERRFKALSLVMKNEATDTIVELAAGLSPRGLIFSENPSLIYIETDLPELITQKEAIASKLFSSPRQNICFKPLNALVEADFKNFFTDLNQPVTILHEGLLSYLSQTEIKTLVLAIHRELATRGGCWITPDIFIKEMYQRFLADLQGVSVDEAAQTGRSTLANCFANFQMAEQFFDQLGFTVKRYKQRELVPKINSYTNAEMEEIMADQEVWVMRAN